MTETKSPENKLGPVQVSRERADSHAKDWQRVPKLRASVDAIVASPLAALKKDAVVTGAEQTVAGTGWLPSCLRVRTAEATRTEAAPDNTNRVPDEPALAA